MLRVVFGVGLTRSSVSLRNENADLARRWDSQSS